MYNDFRKGMFEIQQSGKLCEKIKSEIEKYNYKNIDYIKMNEKFLKDSYLECNGRQVVISEHTIFEFYGIRIKIDNNIKEFIIVLKNKNKINYERYSEIYFRPLKNFCYMYIDNNNFMFDNLYLNIMEKYESMGDIPKAVYIVHKKTKDKDFIVGHKTRDLKCF